MTPRQKRAAATISFGILVLSATFLGVLAYQTGMLTDPLGDHFAGRQFILLAHTRGTLETLLEALPAIISLGMSIIAGSRLRDWQFYATVAVTIVGIAACIYLVVELDDPNQARRFWAYSPINEIYNKATFAAVSKPFLVAAGGWFVAVLGIQLGVTAPQGGPPSTPPKQE